VFCANTPFFNSFFVSKKFLHACLYYVCLVFVSLKPGNTFQKVRETNTLANFILHQEYFQILVKKHFSKPLTNIHTTFVLSNLFWLPQNSLCDFGFSEPIEHV
jgi:hypothetical protein